MTFVPSPIVVLLLIVISSGVAKTYGPRMKTAGEQCHRNSQCDVNAGEVCLRRFEGCGQGNCMCDPDTPFLDDRTGKCIRALREGDACRQGDRCPSGMECAWGYCRCTIGKPTKDHIACMDSTDRLLGQSCQDGDECYQKLHSGEGYTQNDVRCIDNKCRCEPGFREHGLHCYKRKIGEDCRENDQCTGDAMCLNSRCNCLDGYRIIAGGTKCAPPSAIIDLPLGAKCNEMDQLHYCASGLVCHRCRPDGPYTCLKYISPFGDHVSAYYSSVGSCRPIFAVVTVCCFLSVLVNLFSCRR